MKKVYDTIQLSRATEISFQLSQSSVEDDPSFDMTKAQPCAPVKLQAECKRASRQALHALTMLMAAEMLLKTFCTAEGCRGYTYNCTAIYCSSSSSNP